MEKRKADECENIKQNNHKNATYGHPLGNLRAHLSMRWKFTQVYIIYYNVCLFLFADVFLVVIFKNPSADIIGLLHS